jgi:sarcosine oxidase delta subunit
MSGKGSKPRPIDVDRKTYEANWDRIFERENPLEGVSMWEHHCAVNGRHLVGTGEECSWCGGKEEDEL